MPTPSYTALDETKPAIASDTRTAGINNTMTNFRAVRDAVVKGKSSGWSLSVTNGTGTAEEPQFKVWTKGSERIRATFVYTSGAVTQILWEWSNDSGSTYVTIDSETAVYDGGGNMTSGNNQGLLSWLYEWIAKIKSLRTSFNSHSAATTGAHGTGTMALQNASSIAATGGTLNNVSVGQTTPQLGTFKQARGVHSSVSFGATTTLDWSAAESFDFTATGTGAATLAFTNLPPSGTAAYITVEITNGGLRTWTYPTGTKFVGGVAPVLSSAGRDRLTFLTRNGGSTIDCAMFGKGWA